jgi:prevent-host-death family protein
MQRIGIRELRQHASRYLREVERGETIEITDRGRPVARLSPVPIESNLERLIVGGRATPASRPWNPNRKPLPLPPGEKPPSQILAEMREHER